jgi:hypothetical protein
MVEKGSFSPRKWDGFEEKLPRKPHYDVPDYPAFAFSVIIYLPGNSRP